jgi:hypothetical protein
MDRLLEEEYDAILSIAAAGAAHLRRLQVVLCCVVLCCGYGLRVTTVLKNHNARVVIGCRILGLSNDRSHVC